MARRTPPKKESVLPTLPPQRAIELLRQQLGRIDGIEKTRYDDPEIIKWETTATNVLHGAFGKPDGEMHPNTYEFASCDSGESMHVNMTSAEVQRHHQLRTKRRKALLESFIEQLEILAPPLTARTSTPPAEAAEVQLVKLICRRFHVVSRQLTRRHDNRETIEVRDEYDVQDLVHALLGLHFDDVRPEECTPSYAGGASRMDFLLKNERLVIEAKMTRAGLGEKQIGEQLIVDAARYRAHPDCRALVCFVYDPEAHLRNPRGIEADLAKLSTKDLEVIAIIAP